MNLDVKSLPPAYKGNKGYIFVSYTRADKEEVIKFIECMNKMGYRIWYDQGIPKNEDYEYSIGRKIIEASYFVTFISKKYLVRKDPLQELLLAMEQRALRKLKIIPIVLEAYDLNELQKQAEMFENYAVYEPLIKLSYKGFSAIQGIIATELNFDYQRIALKAISEIDASCKTTTLDYYSLWKKAEEENTPEAYEEFANLCTDVEMIKKAMGAMRKLIYNKEGEADANIHNNNVIVDMESNTIGSILKNRYELLKLIGSGGMSKVYLARNLELNNYHAIKEINVSSGYHILSEVYENEIQLMKKLQHPCIPRIFDIIKTANKFYIVMDFIEGKTLNKIIEEQGAQPEQEAIKWALEICDVLDYLHTMTPPVIYRDMKPNNIVIRPNGKVALLDFGIAREYKVDRKADTVALGTRGYAAPEQFGSRQTDQRTDIYALGVTLYYTVTGKSCFDQPYSTIPIRQIDPKLSKALEYIIRKCTQMNPEHRYQSCKELIRDLQNIEKFENKYKSNEVIKVAGFFGLAVLTVISVINYVIHFKELLVLVEAIMLFILTVSIFIKFNVKKSIENLLGINKKRFVNESKEQSSKSIILQPVNINGKEEAEDMNTGVMYSESDIIVNKEGITEELQCIMVSSPLGPSQRGQEKLY